jgi:periplasmic protein TonB
MRRDIIIGFLCSILFHGGFLYGEKIYAKVFGSGKRQIAQKTEDKKVLEVIEMPKLEEEEQPPTEEAPSDVAAQVVEFAPPMQTDMPSVVTVDSFVQAVAPPPPEGLKPNPGVLAIPKGGSGAGMQTKLTQVFNMADLDQKPQPRLQSQPQYPFEMRRNGIEGEVLVEFIINVNGDTQDAFVVKSSQREFEQNALQAVLKWKFKPGKKGGKTVNVRARQNISFSLNN